MTRVSIFLSFLACLYIGTVNGAINLNRGGTCLTGSIGEFLITVDYVAGNGDEKTASYSVPDGISLSSNCVSDNNGQEATIRFQFSRDEIVMKFATSSNVIGRPIYLKKIEYNFVRDSRRFPLLLREDTQKIKTSFGDGDASFGVTGKHFKCVKMTLLLPNGIKFELRNLQIGLFKTRDLYGEITCAGSTHRVTEAPHYPHEHHRSTPRSPVVNRHTTGWRRTDDINLNNDDDYTAAPQPTSFVLPIRFNKERCVTGNALVSFTVPYVDRHKQKKVAKYKMPQTAQVVMSCSERSLRTKHAWLGFRWNDDSLNLEFTAPAVSGNKLSLVNANYTVRHDSQRFPGAEGAIHTLTQTFAPGAVKAGEWHKFFSCPKFSVDFGSGVTAEFNQLRLALFSTPSQADVTTCAAA